MGCKLPAHPLRAPYSLLVAVRILDVNLMLDQRLEHAWCVQGARKEDARSVQGLRKGCARCTLSIQSRVRAVPFNLKNIFLSVRDATTPN